MVFDPVEAVKFIGGLGGIASTLFLIYDRTIRFRPSVFFRPYDNAVYLVVKNSMPETLIVNQVSVTPPHLGLAFGDDLRSTIEAVVDARPMSRDQISRTFVVVDPLAEKLCRLVKLAGFDELPGDLSIKFRCQWRSTGRPFFFKRNVTVSTTVLDILRMQKESHRTSSFWDSPI